MSDQTTGQATHTDNHAKSCRIKAAAQLSALLDDTGADAARINQIQSPNRQAYTAMMSAAVSSAG